MAFTHGKNVDVYAGSYDMTTYFTDVNAPRSVQMVDTSTFGATYKSYVAGLQDATLSFTGFFDGSANASDQVLASLMATSSVYTVAWTGDTIGNRCSLTAGILNKYEPKGSIGGAVGVSAEVQSTGGLDSGVMLHNKQAETGTGNATSVDNTAQTTNGFNAILHVFAIAGAAPSVTCKVQDSADNVTFADLTGATFTTITAATSEQKIGTGTVRRYVRAVHTFGGTTSSITYAMSFARR